MGTVILVPIAIVYLAHFNAEGNPGLNPCRIRSDFLNIKYSQYQPGVVWGSAVLRIFWGIFSGGYPADGFLS